MTHEAKVKPGSIKSTGQGIAYSVVCCDYEETFHIEHLGMYSDAELQRKMDDAKMKIQEHHANHCTSKDAVERLAKANQ